MLNNKRWKVVPSMLSGMDSFAGLLKTISVQFYRTTKAVQCKYCFMTCTLVHLVATWATESYFSFVNPAFIFRLWIRRLKTLSSRAVFVRLTNTVPRSLRVCYTLWRIHLLRLSTWRWILLCPYPPVHVGMMLFLASLIGLVEHVCLYLLKLLLVPWMLPIYFLRNGYVDMVFLKKLLVIVMCVLHQDFGNNCLVYLAVELLCLQLTTLKRMVLLSGSTVLLSRFCAAIVPLIKSSGMHALLSVSLRWIVLSKQLLVMFLSVCCMVNRQPSRWMCRWLLCSCLLLPILFPHGRQFNSVSWTLSKSRNRVWRSLQTVIDVILSLLWVSGFGCLPNIYHWRWLLGSCLLYGLDLLTLFLVWVMLLISWTFPIIGMFMIYSMYLN